MLLLKLNATNKQMDRFARPGTKGLLLIVTVFENLSVWYDRLVFLHICLLESQEGVNLHIIQKVSRDSSGK